MLSITKNLLKKSSMSGAHNDNQLKPLTVVYWSEFTRNPSILYNLFAPNSRKLTYDPDHVKVIGTKDGMVNQINISCVEDLEFFNEQMLSVPILLRVWVSFSKSSYVGNTHQESTFENDLALLIDTSHPRIRPHLERGMEEARKLAHAKQLFCVQIDSSSSFEHWLRSAHKTSSLSSCCKMAKHETCLYITNHTRPNNCFRCNPLWSTCFLPCWLSSAPCYKCYRKWKCKDVLVCLDAPIVRRTVSTASGRFIEVDVSR